MQPCIGRADLGNYGRVTIIITSSSRHIIHGLFTHIRSLAAIFTTDRQN
jgi:hypothetical protein